MSEQYLLPCTCGQKTVVTARQAGETLQCECGRDLAAPTIRGLRNLERVGDDELDRPLWSVRQGVIFIGSVLTVTALVFAGYLWLNFPKLDPEVVRREFGDLTPAGTWHVWRNLRTELREEPSPWVQVVVKAIQTTNRWLSVGLVAAVVGIVIIVAGFFIPTPRGRPRIRTPA